MIKGGVGGANTKTGLHFEEESDFLSLIKKQEGYKVDKNQIYYKGEMVAMTFKKHELYRYLESKGIDYKDHISKRILPDDAIFVMANDTMYIIEIKFQHVAGSTDEKLQTCDFKIKQYRKLLSKLNLEVQYIYILNTWFEKPEYKDVLDYIISIPGCFYYFEYLPLKKLGLPIPKEK